MRKTEGRNALDEAQSVFERVTDEVSRRAELEQAGTQTRGPIARLLLVLTIAACLLAAATGLYGAYKFPDAPVRKTGNIYAGKGGTIHTAEEFEAFVLWRQAMFILFPSAFVLGFAFALTEARQRRKKRS